MNVFNKLHPDETQFAEVSVPYNTNVVVNACPVCSMLDMILTPQIIDEKDAITVAYSCKCRHCGFSTNTLQLEN